MSTLEYAKVFSKAYTFLMKALDEKQDQSTVKAKMMAYKLKEEDLKVFLSLINTNLNKATT